MKTLGYYNGKYDEIDNMTIPMNDRTNYFGDGVYDAGPCHNYHIFALQEHIDRFYRSASMLKIEIPMEKADFADLLNEMVHKLDSGDIFVYYQVSRGTADRNHAFPENTPANLSIMLRPSVLNPCKDPVQLITTEDTRFFHCNIKTLNLIPSVMAAQKAKEAGCFESVFIRPDNRVTECAHSNVHILKDGVFRTAPTDNLILPGIARAHLIKACHALNIPVDEHPFTREELMGADEILTSSSSNICTFADKIDGVPVGRKDQQRLSQIKDYVFNEFYEETK